MIQKNQVTFTFLTKLLSTLTLPHTLHSIYKHSTLDLSQRRIFIMQTLTILIILAMRSIFSEALDNPEGLVQVTVGDSQYLFSPNQIIAPSRTRIQFFFYGVSSSLHIRSDQFHVAAFQYLDLQNNMSLTKKNYSVVQSAFDTPCHPAPNAFYSGFISSSLSGPLAPITFTITLNDTHPIWFYCSQEDFCQRYMVGVINPYVEF